MFNHNIDPTFAHFVSLTHVKADFRGFGETYVVI